jgi:hypothetical protein
MDGLTNSNNTPTLELQDAYRELRKFLTLRTNEELQLSISERDKLTSSERDEMVDRSLAMSSILSPDGAFFTKDIEDVLKQMSLAPRDDNANTGDINVYGAAGTSYGGKLFDVLGINSDKFKTKPGLTSDIIYAEADKLNLRLKQITTEKTNTKDQQKIDALKQEEADLNKQVQDLYQAAWDIKLSDRDVREATSVLSNNVNTNGVSPSPPRNTHLSLYRHVAQFLDPASTSSDYCNVFFNAIDSINMSLCVPYFRMNIIDRFAKKKGRYSKLSLAAFLKQTTDVAGDKIFYQAEPYTTNTSSTVAKKLKSGKVVGMETFFAPQTLLPDPTEVLTNPRRLDTSSPLLTLNSFSIGIETVGIALLSKKTADLSITLHDRSRLADISPLISVGNFSSLYFEIEWGWTHPHGAAKFDNPVARYLNSLRFREIFSPTSYNMSMSEGGAMNITIRLIGGASLDAVNGSVLNGGFLTRSYALQVLDKLIKADIREEDGEARAAEEVRAVTTVLTDKSRTADMVNRKFLEEIWTYTESEDRTPAARAGLITRLQDVLTQSAYYKNEEIYDIIKKNLPTPSKYTPASRQFEKLTTKYQAQVDDKDFTSVAGYLALLVGMPLAATGLYSEVQLHTFKFNDAAGLMSGKQIADAPIRVNEILRNPDQEGSLAKNSSIANALSLLANYLNNPKQPLYGISSTASYTEIKSDESKKPDAEPTAKADTKAKEAPDTFKKPDNFTTPNIRYIIRSIPAKEYSDETKKTLADYYVNPEKLIAQIIIYDANSSPSFEKIIGAYSYGQLSNANGRKVTPDLAKQVFKRAFPSIIYGATNTMLKSVSVSTDINNAISQQNIIDIGKDFYMGRSKSDASTDVSEISLFPGSVTVAMIGLPIIERGQEVYLDLGTGTTLDALYYVTSVKHDFRPGDFTTNLTLTYKGQGSVMSLTTMLEKFNETLPTAAQVAPPAPPATSAPTTSDPPPTG